MYFAIGLIIQANKINELSGIEGIKSAAKRIHWRASRYFGRLPTNTAETGYG